MSKIYINAKLVEWNNEYIHYATIVKLAWPDSQSNKGYTIVCSFPDGKSCTVINNEFTKVIEGMVIDCTRTDNA